MPVDCARAQFLRGLAKEEREIPKLRVYVLYGKRRKKKKGGGQTSKQTSNDKECLKGNASEWLQF